MIRGIIIAVFVILVAVGGYTYYMEHYSPGGLGSGDVVARRAPADPGDNSNATTTDLDGSGNINGALPTPSRSDTPGTVNTEPVGGQAAGAGNQLTSPSPSGTMTGAPTGTMVAPDARTALPPSLPVADSIAPNPPNGNIFAGTGAYQWYRQGNLTWRVNSKNGSACIAFATMEEWQKSIVSIHGCGRSA